MTQVKKESAGDRKAPFCVVVAADSDPEGWLAARLTLLTATDMPSILGVPGARSALETWYQKKDALMARSESEAIRQAKAAGHDFEDFNALMFSKATHRHVDRSQELLRSTRYPWLGCTLDYWQTIKDQPQSSHAPFHVLRAPLETKNVGSFAAQEMWPVGGEPHLTWQVQLLTQMIVTRASLGSLSAWVGAPFVHHRWCDLERDAQLEAILLEEGSRFWRSLKRKSPPKSEPTKVALEVLKRLSPAHATGKVISLPPSAVLSDGRLRDLLSEQEEARAELKAITDRVDAERGHLASLIGERAGGRLAGGAVWKFEHVHVPAHTVAAYSYRKLTRVAPTKPKRTTWKTSR